MCGIHQEWVRQWLETPKFSSNRERWEGVGKLLDLSHTGAVAGAGSWENSRLCDAPLEPDQAFPILPPPSPLTARALQHDEFQPVVI